MLSNLKNVKTLHLILDSTTITATNKLFTAHKLTNKHSGACIVFLITVQYFYNAANL